MESCCHGNEPALLRLWASQARTLRTVLVINSSMFLAEVAAGIIAGSVALMADSLDMLGDALVYGFSLYAIGRSCRERASVALLKGGIMLLFGLGVLIETGWKVVTQELPIAPLMGVMGLIALAANGLCLFLLSRHREDDINMRSTWVCSRNDIIANLGVLLAAICVHRTHTIWPDVLVSLIIAGLFVWSATGVVRAAWNEIKDVATTS
jgi:cation diffusion facilitator family transporter